MESLGLWEKFLYYAELRRRGFAPEVIEQRTGFVGAHHLEEAARKLALVGIARNGGRDDA